MEYGQVSGSDKDARMRESFESYSDSEKSKEKKSKKKKKPGILPGESSEEKAEQKKKHLAEPEAKEKKSLLEQLFEQRDDEKHEDNNEPALPEKLEELSEEEAALITKQLLEARSADLRQELSETEADSAEEAEVLADALYVDKLAEKIEDGGEVDESELDAVMQETIAELEVRQEPDEAEDDHAEEPEMPAPEGFADEEDSAGKDDSLHAAVRIHPPSGGGPAGGGLPPGSAGGTLPPASPGPHAGRLHANIGPIAAPEMTPRYHRGTDLLVGGIIGYLIGRRRGRIKTEARLLPVQKSLENKVKDLDEKIKIREKKIRALTAEKISREGEEAKRKIAAEAEAKAREKFEAKQEAKAAARQAERSPERMARMFLPKPEAMVPPQEVQAVDSKETAAKMSEAELLLAAAKIEINGQNLKSLYERGLIGKQDLREIVIEHLRGSGKVERLLAERIRNVSIDEGLEIMQGGQKSGTDTENAGGSGALPTINTSRGTPAFFPNPQQSATKPTSMHDPRLAKKTKVLQNQKIALIAAVSAAIIILILAALISLLN